MPHINLEENVPGIRSLVMFRPDTGKPLYELVQTLLRGPSTLTEAEREVIAATVSSINACKFCNLSHSAAARELAADQDWINDALEDPEAASISPKMKALLVIASHVTASGKSVTADDVQKARQCGATDREIHDTVLIAATFNLFNRYVDGLATFTPTDPGVYEQMGKRMANGYVLPQKN